MGNASKALVMAGGMLISILIISICMYMYTSFKSAYMDNMLVHDSVQIAAFNSFFTSFTSPITGYEAYNILGKIDEANNNPDSLTTIYLEGPINLDNYKTTTFYFTETLTENTYNYSYSDTNGDGLIDKISITE